MKGTEAFKKQILAYLKEYASKDALFAESFKKPAKKIEDCITYIFNEVKRSGKNGFADDEIYRMAIHFYDEDNIEPGKSISGSVVVNHHVELSDEEKNKAKNQAIERATLELVSEVKKDLKLNVQLTEDELAEAKQIALNNAISEAQKKISSKPKGVIKNQDRTESSLF